MRFRKCCASKIYNSYSNHITIMDPTYAAFTLKDSQAGVEASGSLLFLHLPLYWLILAWESGYFCQVWTLLQIAPQVIFGQSLACGSFSEIIMRPLLLECRGWSVCDLQQVYFDWGAENISWHFCHWRSLTHIHTAPTPCIINKHTFLHPHIHACIHLLLFIDCVLFFSLPHVLTMTSPWSIFLHVRYVVQVFPPPFLSLPPPFFLITLPHILSVPVNCLFASRWHVKVHSTRGNEWPPCVEPAMLQIGAYRAACPYYAHIDSVPVNVVNHALVLALSRLTCGSDFLWLKGFGCVILHHALVRLVHTVTRHLFTPSKNTRLPPLTRASSEEIWKKSLQFFCLVG